MVFGDSAKTGWPLILAPLFFVVAIPIADYFLEPTIHIAPLLTEEEQLIWRNTREFASERVYVMAGVPLAAESSHHGVGIPTNIRRRIEPNLVRAGE